MHGILPPLTIRSLEEGNLSSCKTTQTPSVLLRRLLDELLGRMTRRHTLRSGEKQYGFGRDSMRRR